MIKIDVGVYPTLLNKNKGLRTMDKITNHPVFRLLFDLSANEGWNLIAMMTYTLIFGLVILAIREKKGG